MASRDDERMSSPDRSTSHDADLDEAISGAPRVGHKKSRNGCAQCKRRHVKCNEEKPCANCVRHGVACSLAGGPNVTRDDLRPRRSPADSTSTSRQGSVTDSSEVFSPGSDYRGASPIRRLTRGLDRAASGNVEKAWMMDLKLMHHFDKHAADFIGESDWTDMWQQDLPQIAFTAPYLMHVMLGISALHKAFHQSQKSPELRSAAAKHLDQALVGFRESDGPVTSENAEARFCFSFALCLFAYATPISGAPIDAVCELFGLVKCVELVAAETFVWVVAGPLAPMMNRSLHEVLRLSSDNGVVIPPGMELGVDHLEYMLSMEPTSIQEEQALTKTLQELKTVYSNVVTAGSATGVSLVICWPKTDSAEFCQLLKARKPQALVMLAYYAVVLDLLDNKWYLRGWSSSLLQNIVAHLDDRWKSWIQWPVKTILMKDIIPTVALSSDFDDDSKMTF